jgi:peptidoglycan/xylan/chitin deacetylase (PgdA/CDA1 family)
MTLGNHTYSHPDFNALTIDAFRNDIIKGETGHQAPDGSADAAASVLSPSDDAHR